MVRNNKITSMKMPRFALFILAALIFALLPTEGAYGRAGAAVTADSTNLTGVDACAASGGAEAVVQFYLALDRREFGAAYRCLDPSLRGGMSLESFTSGYATTLEIRLLIADELPHGQVSIDLHAVDRHGVGFLVSTYRGTWDVSANSTLLHPAIRLVRRVLVSRVAATDVADVFAFDGQRIVSAVRADVTGDGVPDVLYVTSGRAGSKSGSSVRDGWCSRRALTCSASHSACARLRQAPTIVASWWP